MFRQERIQLTAAEEAQMAELQIPGGGKDDSGVWVIKPDFQAARLYKQNPGGIHYSRRLKKYYCNFTHWWLGVESGACQCTYSMSSHEDLKAHIQQHNEFFDKIDYGHLKLSIDGWTEPK